MQNKTINKWDETLIERANVLRGPERNWKLFAKKLKQKDIRLLDLGCGFGRNSLFLAKRKWNVFCMDNSIEGLKLLKNSIKASNLKIDVKRGDIYHTLPYQSNFFDAIVSIHVIHHSDEKQIKKLIAEMYRILKPHGYIFITVAKSNSTQKISSKMKKIAERTYVPIDGSERGIPHYMFNKQLLKVHFKKFKMISIGSDKEKYGEYYYLIAQKK